MADALALTQAFVVTKNIDFILLDGAASGAAELVAAKFRFLKAIGIFKEVRGGQSAVAYTFLSAAVKLVGARARYGIDNSTGGIPVLRRIVAGEDGKLLNRVHAEVLSEHASRAGI